MVMAIVPNITEMPPGAKQEVSIRPIVTKDIFTVLKVILPKLNVSRVRELFTNIPPLGTPNREDYFRTVGIEIVLMVLEVAAADDVQMWLADIAGMTLEQFLDSPIDVPYQIIMAASKDPDLNRVFTMVLR